MISTTKPEIIYQYIINFKVEHDGNSPTIREITQGCHISSTSLANYYLGQLVDEGRIEMSDCIASRKIMVKGGSWALKEMTVVNPSGHYQSSKGDD